MTPQLNYRTVATALFALTTACASAPAPAPVASPAQSAPVIVPSPAATPAPSATANVPTTPVGAAAPVNEASAPVFTSDTASTGASAAGAPANTAETPAGATGKQSLAEGLMGLRLEVPCKAEKFGENTECHWDPALLQTADPQWKLKKEIVRTFAGEPGVTYEVKLRVRGVVEPKNFTGGKIDKEHFQRGGTPVSDDYNFYSIKVSDPAETYTVNRHKKKTSHFVFPIDYTITIPVRGGATVTVGAYDRNDISIANHKNIVIPKVPPAPSAFDGQFFQVDVIDIHKKP